MEKKNILIISRSFYPQNSPRAFRTTELAVELAKSNNVTLIIPLSDDRKKFCKNHGITMLALKKYREEKLDEKKRPLNTLQKVVGRVREQYLLYPQFSIRRMVYESLKTEEGKNYDLLVSVAAPHPIHWGVAKALKNYRDITKCWVADCGDPFMLSHNLQYKRPFYFKYFEKQFCKSADYITIPTINAKDGYYKEFHSKLKVIPQGFNFNNVRTSEKRGETEMLEFGYAGSLIEKRRDPSEFLSFLNKKKINYKFHIFSKNQSFVKKLLKDYPNQIVYQGEAPRLEVLYKLSELDFVLNFENVGTNQTPSKLIDYAIIKKPILAVKYGALNEGIVEEFITGNYKSGINVNNLGQYRIENVARNFLKLCGNEENS